MNSIRSRLLLWVISSVLITTLGVGFLTARLTWSGFNNVRDMGLEQIAQTVMRHGEEGPPPPISSAGLTGADLDQFVSQIWDSGSGRLIYSSLVDVGPPLQPPGHHIVTWKGQSWRLYSLTSQQQTIQVAVTTEIRRRHFYSLSPWLLFPSILLIVTLGILANAGVEHVLRPLEVLRTGIEKQAPEDLKPIDASDLPQEVAPLVQTLNQLLARTEQLINSQRLFLADAAHELNTPLAAVKLQAQLVRKAGPENWQTELDELDAGVDRATRMVSKLLQQARVQPQARPPVIESVALDRLLQEAAMAFEPRMASAGCSLAVELCEQASIRGDAHALRTLLDNLIENALVHRRQAVRVALRLHNDGDQAVLSVSDNGPGIPAADVARVLERFVRLHPGDGKGSGLGLSIVREIAQWHGGDISLSETPGGGLTVIARFPLSDPRDC